VELRQPLDALRHADPGALRPISVEDTDVVVTL